MPFAQKLFTSKVSQEHLFMLSALIVNGGNYLYNLILGRLLGPEAFSDAAVLITFLLVLSFVAMTFQLVTAKFAVVLSAYALQQFISKNYNYAIITGVLFGLSIIIFAPQLQALLNTSTSKMFILFGLGVPLYFIMSVNRGIYQGHKWFKKLAITYQTEMLSRLIFTLLFIYLLNIDSSVIIALGIIVSFGFGLLPINTKYFSFKALKEKTTEHKKAIRKFFIITAFYECTQIIINNSDILLVKHFFEAFDAGLYAALALIGRIVYFIAWMFVMLLLPTVVALKKEGKPTKKIVLKYVIYIACIAFIIVFTCWCFPKCIITILFGNSYLSMGNLLWKYATATGIFAVSNIFAYYYLSIDEYLPVILSGIFGMLQILLIIFFHESLEQVVHVQIITMVFLLIMQLLFFILKKEIKTLSTH